MAQTSYPLSAGIPNAVMTVVNTVSLAEFNAGKTILPEVAGKTYTILDYSVTANGSLATADGMLIQDTNGTPVVVTTIATAALTNGTLNKPTSANNSLGAGFQAALTAGKGVKVIKSGSNGATTTNFKVVLVYKVN
jgi:hypothetical protein